MQLKKTVRKAKHISPDMIIGIDEVGINKVTGKVERRWHKVRNVINDDIISKSLVYFIIRNRSGKLEFLKRNVNAIVPVKVHPNTKEHKAQR